MSDKRPLTVLCVVTFEKGQEFMRECKRLGCRVLLVTLERLREADWPREAVDEFFYMPEDFAIEPLTRGVSYIARTREIERIVPLDDFDVETAAALREHLRVPGMGDTTARHFRDKLAMRMKAREHSILVPEFVHALNHARIQSFTESVAPPWVLKPRSEASAVGISKVESAAKAIRKLNPDVNVKQYETRLDASNIMEIIEGYDVIVDGVDNFPTRYLLNDATVRLGIPVVSASILGFDGQLSVFAPHEGPCYRCLYPTPPPAELAPSCGANGVLGVLPGTMGLLQAIEVVKLVIGAGEPLIGRLLLYEALGATFTELKVRRDPECPICSRDPDAISDDEMGVFPDYEAFCAAAG